MLHAVGIDTCTDAASLDYVYCDDNANMPIHYIAKGQAGLLPRYCFPPSSLPVLGLPAHLHRGCHRPRQATPSGIDTCDWLPTAGWCACCCRRRSVAVKSLLGQGTQTARTHVLSC